MRSQRKRVGGFSARTIESKSMFSEDEAISAAISRQLLAAVECLPRELALIIGGYAQELLHRWQRNDDIQIKILGNVIKASNPYVSRQISSTQSIITGPNRWRVQFEFHPTEIGWIWTGAIVDDRFDMRLTVQKYLCPAISQYADRKVEIHRGHERTESLEYKMKAHDRGQLDFDLDLGGQLLTVSDPSDQTFRLQLPLPPNPSTDDWRPCIVVGGFVTAAITSLPPQ
jgi:hypothetical protein